MLKFAARSNPDLRAYLWKPFIGWEYFENPGIAFSLPFPNWLILIVTPFILLFIFTAVSRRERAAPLVTAGAAAIAAGAISNYIDRVLFGVTIDYLRLFTSVINMADLLIVFGMICLLLAEWKKKKPPVAG